MHLTSIRFVICKRIQKKSKTNQNILRNGSIHLTENWVNKIVSVQVFEIEYKVKYLENCIRRTIHFNIPRNSISHGKEGVKSNCVENHALHSIANFYVINIWISFEMIALKVVRFFFASFSIDFSLKQTYFEIEIPFSGCQSFISCCL